MKASLVCGILSAVLVGTFGIEPTQQPYKPWGQVYKPYVAPYNWTIITKPGNPRPPAVITKPIDFSFVTRPPVAPTTSTIKPYTGQIISKPVELSRPSEEASKPVPVPSWSLTISKPVQSQSAQSWNEVNKPALPSKPWSLTAQSQVQGSKPSQPWIQVSQPVPQQTQPSKPWTLVIKPAVQEPKPSQPWTVVSQVAAQQPQPALSGVQVSQPAVQEPKPSPAWAQVSQVSQQPQVSQGWAQVSQQVVQHPEASLSGVVSQPAVQEPKPSVAWTQGSQVSQIPQVSQSWSLESQQIAHPEGSLSGVLVSQPAAQELKPSVAWAQGSQVSQKPQVSQSWSLESQQIAHPEGSLSGVVVSQPAVQEPKPSVAWAQGSQVSQKPQVSQSWSLESQQIAQHPETSLSGVVVSQPAIQEPKPSVAWAQGSQVSQKPQVSQSWSLASQQIAQHPEASLSGVVVSQPAVQEPKPSVAWAQGSQISQKPQVSQSWSLESQQIAQHPEASLSGVVVSQPAVQEPKPAVAWAQGSQISQKPQVSQSWSLESHQIGQHPEPSLSGVVVSQPAVQEPKPTAAWAQVSQVSQQPQVSQPWAQVSQQIVQHPEPSLAEIQVSQPAEPKPSQSWAELNKTVELPAQNKSIEAVKPSEQSKPTEGLSIEDRQPFQPLKPLEPQQPIQQVPSQPLAQKPLEQSQTWGLVSQQSTPVIVPVVQNSTLQQPIVNKTLEQTTPYIEEPTTTELPQTTAILIIQTSQPSTEINEPLKPASQPIPDPRPLGLVIQPEIATLPQTTLIPSTPYSSYQAYWNIKPFQTTVPCNYHINEQTILAYRKAVHNMSSPLYKRAAALTEGHFVFSPYTIWLTMAAIAEGSSGPAQQELFKLLSLPEDNCARQAYYHLATDHKNAGNDIVLARNRLFVADSGIHVNKQWEDFAKSQTELKTVSVPFKQNPVAEIESLKKVLKAHLPNINLSGNSLLLESLDYHGLWTSAFTDAVVQEGPFYNSFGQQIGVVEYMKTVKPANIGIIDSMNLKIIDLPVGKDGRYRMYFAVPLSSQENYMKNFDSIENSFIIEAAASLKPSLEPVEIVIPKMAMTSELDVRQLFEDVGLRSIWTDPLATRNISDPAAIPSAFTQRVTVTIDDGGLRPAIKEYHNYVPPLHHANIHSAQHAAPSASKPWSVSPVSPSDSHFIANKPFMFGLFDAKTHTGQFSASFSKIHH